MYFVAFFFARSCGNVFFFYIVEVWGRLRWNFCGGAVRKVGSVFFVCAMDAPAYSSRMYKSWVRPCGSWWLNGAAGDFSGHGIPPKSFFF